jgi:hypothetical protein
MSLSPTVTPQRVDPPPNFSAASFAGWNGPCWSLNNPAFVDPPQPDGTGGSGGTLMESIALSDTGSNKKTIAANEPNTFLIGDEYWYTPADLNSQDSAGNKFVVPAGALLCRETQGPSAYVPPAPPVVTPVLQFGLFYGACPWTVNLNGVSTTLMLPTWDAGALTTLEAGQLKPDGGPGAKVVTPGEVIPVDVYTVRMLGGIKWITGSGQ